MGFHLLRESLTRQNVKMPSQPRPTAEQLRTMLIKAGWKKLESLIKKLNWFQSNVAGAERNVADLTSGKASKSDNLYPLLGAF